MYLVLLCLDLRLASLVGTFLDFFSPLHFSASFNLPHCGVILERSFAGGCLLAFSPFCSCSAIIKGKYQHALMFCGPEEQSCIPVCVSF